MARKPDPIILRQFASTIRRLQNAMFTYEHAKLGNTQVEADLRQSELTIQSIQRDLHFT